MKTLIVLYICLSVGLVMVAQPAPEVVKTVTTTFTVQGVCGMCKDRIETALDIKGVRNAVWDVKTHQLKVTFVPAVITEHQLHERVAAAGHDTEHVKAPDAVYNKLPGCCRYRDGVPTHADPH